MPDRVKKKRKTAPKTPNRRKPANPSRAKEPVDRSQDARKHDAFKEARTNADSYAKDPKKLKDLIDRATKRAKGKASGSFEQIWDDLQLMFRMLRAYARGNYREVPYKILISLIAAIAYFLTPVDLIPDILFAFGFLDDAAVLGWAIRQARSNLNAFRKWEETQGIES